MCIENFDKRKIQDFSMTELDNEITRRRMEAERTEIELAEHNLRF